MNRFVPLIDPNNILYRPRIIELIDTYKYVDLIHFEAGAGYGKTQSVLNYAEVSNFHVIWVSLSMLDNFPAHFWATFCQAVRGFDALYGQELSDGSFPDSPQTQETFLRALAGRLYRDRRILLVFDDCHLIEEVSILNLMRSLVLIRHENVTVITLSRTGDFVLGLETAEALDVKRIDQLELEFTEQEIIDYFSQMNISIPAPLGRELYLNTAGWPMAVYLTALSIIESPASLSEPFLYSMPLIHDVIDHDIFSVYTEAEQKVLIQLSLLNSFSVELMKHLFKEDFLAPLTSNLFIRYNRHTDTYHFHHIFRNFLAEKHEMLSSFEVEDFYMRAGQWFIGQNSAIDALHCFHQLGDYDKVIELSRQLIFHRLTCGEETGRRILKILDSFQTRQDVHSSLLKGIILIKMSRFSEGSQYLTNIVVHRPETDPVVTAEAYAFLGLLKMLAGDTSFVDYMRKACEYAPHHDLAFMNQPMLLLNGEPLSLHFGREGEIDAWVRAHELAGNDMDYLFSGSMYGFDLLARAQGLYYQGNINGAEKYALLALEKADLRKSVDLADTAYFQLIKINIFKGNGPKVLEYLDLVKQYHNEYNWNPQLNIPEIAEGFFYNLLEMPDKMPGWIIGDGLEHLPAYRVNFGQERLVKGYYMFTRKQYFELIPYLDQTLQFYESGNRYVLLLYTYILKALTYHRLKDMNQSFSALKTAYNMAAPCRLIMPFIEYGRYMRGYLDNLKANASSPIPEDWLNEIFKKSSTYAKRVTQISRQLADNAAGQTGGPLLSEREIAVLQNLAEGLTREEIAAYMHISSNTVKSICTTIYAKLGAVNGFHAVRIAMVRGIIH